MSDRVGIYVDVENISRNGGYQMQYDVLRRFALRGSAVGARLNAYAAFDEVRAENDFKYRSGKESYFGKLREFGFKIIQKPVKRFKDEDGVEYLKANADLDMAVDILSQSQKLDRVVILTGDGDFVRLVRALQDQGCRVEAIAFDHVSRELKTEVDFFLSGYLIPGLVPPLKTNPSESRWGEEGAAVRGTCIHYDHRSRGGYMRFLAAINENLWITDSRDGESPYCSAAFKIDSFSHYKKADELMDKQAIYEFVLAKNERGAWIAIQISDV